MPGPQDQQSVDNCCCIPINEIHVETTGGYTSEVQITSLREL